jgi:NAD-dependent SIR2 family protein deacetylase
MLRGSMQGDIATLFCTHCHEKLTTVHNGDKQHFQAKTQGLPCPTCKKTVKVKTTVLDRPIHR